MNRKTSMITPSVKTDLSVSMEMIVPLPKKFMIQIRVSENKIKGCKLLTARAPRH